MSKYEKIARRYMELRGLNPDEIGLVPCPDGMQGCCVAHYGPQWTIYAEMAKDRELWERASVQQEVTP